MFPDSADLNGDGRSATALDLALLIDDIYRGPPGTGKTYTAAHLIVELMKKGYKVGVTANSHKVIHNLLSQVERRAKEIDFEFEGVKKASWSSDETNYKGPYIHSVGSTDEAIGSLSSCKLIAGTAWLFANMGESVQIDYIFVEEAGQMSLANYVAVATAARNMILVGDQMQLAQPSQGIHPGESGLSVLNYLLRGRHTIPVEEGIFLETTYRMHPKICEFISEAIYDGRLSSLDGLQNQVVLSKKDAPIEVPEAGLICHFVQHEGSVQQSDEEADHIKKLYDLLLTYKYKDQYEKVHHFTPESILVVSPYNMQVNYLKGVLGDDARVGTVDKFQGQEAEVVIVSMATSSPEEIPRGIDFLYSQNRLNVSLSRAKALSVLVMSPELLSVTCKTPEHMRLVNSLCWVKSHSDTL